jgi:hypothetical protein
MGTRGSLPGGTAAGAWSRPITSSQCQENVDLYIHSPYVFMTVLNYLSTGSYTNMWCKRMEWFSVAQGPVTNCWEHIYKHLVIMEVYQYSDQQSKYKLSRAVAHAVSRRLPSAVAQIRAPSQVIWDLWWTKRHCGTLSPSVLLSSANHSTDRSTLIIIHHPGFVRWPTYQVD